jgi:quercetin dioxygenase-like cupin family protein
VSVVRIESLPDSGNSYRFDGVAHDAPISFFLLHTKPGEGPGLHRHPYAETFIVEEGMATFTVGDDRIEARAGDIVVAPANVPHAFVNSGQDELRSVNIHPAPEMVTEWL